MKIDPRLLKEARYAQYLIALAICLGLIGGFLIILQARGVAKVVNQVFLENKNLQAVIPIIAAVVLIISIRAILIWGSETTAGSAGRKIKQGLREQLIAHLHALGPANLQGEVGGTENQTGALVNLATEGIDALDAYFSQYLPQLALAALVPIAILIFVFPLDPLSGVILLVTAPLLPVFMYLIGSAAETLTRKQWLGLSRMSAYFLDVLQGLTTLKALGRSQRQAGMIQEVSDQYRRITMGVLKVTFLSALALELVATLSTAVVAVEIGVRLLYGRLAFEQAFCILLLAPEFYLPLRLLGTRFHAGMAGVEAAKRIYEILDQPLPSSHQNGATDRHSPQPVTTPPTITFNNVKFAYANDPVVLDQVSFDVPAGKITALTGDSGAGKSTLTWLLMRFLLPQAGEILVDGERLAQFPLDAWHASLAWVPQNPYLFNDTIAANIRLADPQANINAVQHAARLAHADEFIRGLPHGYETLIGERGTRLSMGQAQRIALARAFLKDAPLLILDEATSHLDPETNELIQDSIRQLTCDRTVLIIAHQQATIQNADQVVKLSHGKVETTAQQVHLPKVATPAVKYRHGLDAPPMESKPGLALNPPESLKDKPAQPRLPLSRLLKTMLPFWPRIGLAMGLGFATILSGVGLMAASAYIISAAALHPSIAELQVAIVGVRFFGLSRGVFRYLERLTSHDVTFRLLASWRVWFYQALEPLAPARLKRYHSGDLLTRAIRDIGSLETFYVRALNPPLVAILVSGVVLLFLNNFGLPLVWGLMVFLIFAGILQPILTTYQARGLGVRMLAERAQLSTLLIDSFQGLPDLIAFGQADQQQLRVRQAGNRLIKIQGRIANLSAVHTALGSLFSNLAMITVLVLGIQMVSEGQLSGVYLGVVALTALTCFEAIQPLPQVAQNLEANRAALGRLYELVDAPQPVVDLDSPRELPARKDLEIQNLSFAYPAWADSESPSTEVTFSLKDISFDLPQGKHIALLGASGAGKSTLANLLMRFWEYQQGSIRLGGNELHDYPQEHIRGLIGLVGQDTYLFCATVKENLLIAKPSATDVEIMQALGYAQLDNFIRSLPAGTDTWIGEHGFRLSAGERQRLAIARLILKDAPLLILDEPTVNLDPATEGKVLNSVQQLSRGRSTITISQNMVGLESMDEILVLRAGEVTERGTHVELLAKHGLYYRMWNLYHQIV
ncbi:MAG: ABC transporter [Anaerolineales bacterium]|nr:thiol reductant ABC exporter subunit CydD [Anaerolineae bacterium]PWB54120.1 MAG: ABC transporter [Anaerolineales bacterium]